MPLSVLLVGKVAPIEKKGVGAGGRGCKPTVGALPVCRLKMKMMVKVGEYPKVNLKCEIYDNFCFTVEARCEKYKEIKERVI